MLAPVPAMLFVKVLITNYETIDIITPLAQKTII
jgi:hypothetical protein